jgi:DNA repair protein RadA/Sms
VLDRTIGLGLARAELYGATLGGLRLDDPATDLAIAAALVSAVTGLPPPPTAAFVGEIDLTGRVRPPSSLPGRIAAAKAGGCDRVYVGGDPKPVPDMRLLPVRHVIEAFDWADDRDVRQPSRRGLAAKGPRRSQGGLHPV